MSLHLWAPRPTATTRRRSASLLAACLSLLLATCPGAQAQPVADTDGDGIADALDVCPTVADPAQEDADSDGVGDACDNCPAKRNRRQRDRDQDGIGDSCDVCRTVANADQNPAVCACPCYTAEELDAMPAGSANYCFTRDETNLCHVVWIQSNLMMHVPESDADTRFGFVGPFRNIPYNGNGHFDRKASTFGCFLDLGFTCQVLDPITRPQYQACIALLTSSRPWQTSGCPN